MRVRGSLTTVRRAVEEDANLLVSWHADPDVSRYWDGDVFTRDEMLERLRRPNVEAFVIEEGAHPVGGRSRHLSGSAYHGMNTGEPSERTVAK